MTSQAPPSFEKDDNYISVVIHHAYGVSTQVLVAFIRHVDGFFAPRMANYEYVIVANGQRMDANYEALHAIHADIAVIDLSWKHNIEDAMMAGIQFAKGDLIYEIDGVEHQFDTEILGVLYEKCLTGFDCVTTTSASAKLSFWSRVFYSILKRFSAADLGQEYVRIITRRMVNRVGEQKGVFQYRKYNYHFSGLKLYEVQVDRPLTSVRTGFSFVDRLSLASSILIYYSSIGARISLYLSMGFMLLTFLTLAYTGYSYVAKHDYIQSGWTTTMIVLSISFGGVFGLLAIISKYLQVILSEVKGVSPYTYRSIKSYPRA